MKSSEILREARKLIESGEHNHVCLAIGEIACSDHIVRRICESIYPCRDVASWLHDNHRKKYLDLLYIDFGFRDYRLAWIDWMIEGYEAIGD